MSLKNLSFVVNCQRACKKCDDCRPCQRCVRYHLEESCQNSARRERKRGVRRGPYKRRSSSTILLDSLQERRRSQSVPPDGRLHFPETSENPIFRALTAFERSEMFPQGTPSPFHTMVDSQLHNSFPSDSAGIVEQSHNFQSFLPHDISFYTAHKSPVVSITHSASQGSMSPVDTGGRMLYSPLPIKLHYSESLERSPRRLFQYPDGTVRSLKNFSAMDFEGSSLNEARGTNRMAFHTPTPVKLSSILPLDFSNSPCPTSDICATRSLMLEQPSYTVISDFSENPQCSLSALSELCTSELVSGTQYAPKNPQISTNELSSL